MPTEEEMARTFTDSEMKHLCRKMKCRVDMWKWNPVDEFREKLKRDGRFLNRSERYCLRLTAKAVNLHWNRIKYDDNDISSLRQEASLYRRKEYIMKLERVLPVPQIYLTAPHETSPQLLHAFNNELMNGHNDSKEEPADSGYNIIEFNVELTHNRHVKAITEIVNASQQNQDESQDIQGTEIFSQPLYNSMRSIADGSSDSAEELTEDMIPNPVSEEIVTQSQFPEKTFASDPLHSQRGQNELDSEYLRLIDANPELCHIFNGTTESFTINTEELAKEYLEVVTSQGINTQEVNNINYTDFDKKVPLTSTQEYSWPSQDAA